MSARITGNKVNIKQTTVVRNTESYGWTRREALATILVVALVIPVIILIVLACVYGIMKASSSLPVASSITFASSLVASIIVSNSGSFISQCTAAGQSLQLTFTYILDNFQVTLGYPDILFSMTGPSSITCINLPVFLRPQTVSPVIVNNLSGFDNSLPITTATMKIFNASSGSAGNIEITDNGALFSGGSSIGGVTANTLVYNLV